MAQKILLCECMASSLSNSNRVSSFCLELFLKAGVCFDLLQEGFELLFGHGVLCLSSSHSNGRKRGQQAIKNPRS